jgi:hypothetical protein
MAEKYDTKPTIETVLESINALGARLQGEIESLRQETQAGFAAINKRLDAMDIRLDRLEGFAHQTQSEVSYLRADFKELKSEFYEFRSQFKAPA